MFPMLPYASLGSPRDLSEKSWYGTALRGSPTGLPPGSRRSKVAPRKSFGWCRLLGLAGFWLWLGAGLGWLAFRISAGFRLDSSGLALDRFLVDLASGFHLLRFCLDLA